jgi:hypothetical protein
MSRKITLEGIGYGVSFIELPDADLAQFLEEMKGVDDVTDVQLVSDLVSNSFYEYGLLLADESLSLKVDGEDKTHTLKKTISSGDYSVVDLTDLSNSNWLYYEAVEKVKCTIEVYSFDPEKIDLIKYEVMLPNKTTKKIISICYADIGFDPWDTTSTGEVYVILKNGEIITF